MGRLRNQGVVLSVRGSVVEMRFDYHLPPIYALLRAGANRDIVIEVLAQPDARSVRGIALTTHYAPWYAVPADDKDNARLVVSRIVLDALGGLDMAYPKTNAKRRLELAAARVELDKEDT